MKKTVSILLAITLLFSALVLPVNAISVTDDDIAYFNSNIQKLKDLTMEKGEFLTDAGTKRYVISTTHKVEKDVFEVDSIYFTDNDEMRLVCTSFGSDMRVGVTLHFTKADEPAFFEYCHINPNTLGIVAMGQTENFDMITYPPESFLIGYSIVDSRLKDTETKVFTSLVKYSVHEWNDLLTSLIGCKLPGIGFGAANEEHDTDKNGFCKNCGRTVFDVSKCSCTCHKTDFFSRFITSFKMIFWKLFRIKQTCDCGINHY